MELSGDNNVEITTFINPHLFWFVLKNKERGQLLNNLNQQLHDTCWSTNKLPDDVFEVGEIVATQINDQLYRAVIEDIDEKSYLVWLIDFGTLRESNTIFKLPSLLRKTPPLSIQASLNNVVYIEQEIEYDSCGQATCVNKHIVNPPSHCRQKCIKHLMQAYSIKFKFEKKDDGITFGDLICRDKDKNEISLRHCLTEAGILAEDEKLFEGISDFIYNYKENHLVAISKICNKEPYPLELEEEKKKNNLKDTCMNIVSKVLEEFDYSDILDFEDKCAEPLWSKLNRSKNDTMSSTSDIETPTKTKSKKELLMEKLWQHKNSEKSNVSLENVISTSTDNTDSKNESNLFETKVVSTSKIKKMCEKLKNHKITKEKPLSGKPVANTNRKIIFTAAGSERTFVSVNNSKKEKARSRWNYSSDESSSEPVKNVSKIFRSHKEPITPNRNEIKIKTKSFAENSKNSITKTDTVLETTTEEKETTTEDNEITTDEKETTTTTEEKETPSDEIDSSPEEISTVEQKTTNVAPSVSTLKIKPHCSCKQCNIWTKEENISIEHLPKHQKVTKLIGVNNQLLFKENENIESHTNICSIDYSSMKKIEKQAMQKLLVHSESIVNPIHTISNMALDRHILQNLYKLDYRQAKRIQSYVWPAILRNQHVFMINGPQSGKTMAYLPLMCTFILEKHDRYDSLLKVAGGPIVVILCENTQKCEDVYDLAKVILGHIKANVSIVTYPLTHVNTSHTDMLITTPYILVDLLKSKSVNFKRLCHLIIEDGDSLLPKYRDPMNAIFELAQSMLKNRVFMKAVQLIVCAEHWNTHVKSLMTSLQQIPMVCIGNYLESALYGKLEFSMKFINSSCKQQELKHLLKEFHRLNRSIIICEENEIEEIHEIMTLKGIDTIPMYASLSQEDIMHYEVVWTEAKEGTYSVLICSDFVFNTLLSVTCATTLIHYSLPQSWSKFIKRFCCLLENCHSPLDAKQHNIISKNVVLCDETCNEQMYRFFKFINSTELKKQLPEKLQQFSENLKLTEEEQKLEKEIALCGNLKLFGKCMKKQCPRRHLVSQNLDISNYLPKSGKIKFKIVNVVDVTSYSIKLLQHVDNENKIHEYEESADITEDVTATLRLGRKIVHHPVIGHHYAFYNFDEQEGMYYRCEVLDKDNDSVKIKLLDKGTIVSTLVSRIYRLPKEFDCNVKPRTIIDAFLANYVPPYDDENFSAKSFHKLETILEKHNYKNVIFSAEVHLQLNHSLWLKDVCEEITLSDQIIPGFQLSREILLKKLVDSDPNQLKKLYKLCTDAGIVLPIYEKPKVIVPIKKEKVKLQWAHLEIDKINEVTFAAAFSPEELYLRLNKFSDLLFTLQKEIQQSVRKPNYPKLQEVKAGEVYLAKDPVSEEYCRVLVIKKESEKVLCFYLDFGDEAIVPIVELKYILPVFISKLPFQCIQCSLYGIAPFSETWEEDATNILYEYAHEPGTDIFRSLYLKVYKKESSTSTSGTKYSVILKDGFGEKNVIINQLLIDCGLVTTNADVEIADFEIPSLQHEDIDSDEEELDSLAYICEKTNELEQTIQSGDTEYHPNYDEMEFFILGDPFDFYRQFIEGVQPTPTGTSQLPAITASPQVDYYTPEVYWSQTDTLVRLIIKLIDVKECKLTLTKGRIMNFRTVKDQKTYCLKMMFYEMVETMQYTLTGQEIRITLTKIKRIDWPRLILSKQKARNIHYDITKIPDEDKPRRFLQLPKELDDEDSEGLNEDDPMYTVVSDLDSDLDVELAHDSD